MWLVKYCFLNMPFVAHRTCPLWLAVHVAHDVAHNACTGLRMWLTMQASRCGSWCGSLSCLMVWLTFVPHGVAHFHASWCGSPCVLKDVAHCVFLMMWLTMHTSWCGSLPCLKMCLTAHTSRCNLLCMLPKMWLTLHAS